MSLTRGLGRPHVRPAHRGGALAPYNPPPVAPPTFAQAASAVHVAAAGQAEARRPARRLEAAITEHPGGHARHGRRPLHDAQATRHPREPEPRPPGAGPRGMSPRLRTRPAMLRMRPAILRLRKLERAVPRLRTSVRAVPAKTLTGRCQPATCWASLPAGCFGCMSVRPSVREEERVRWTLVSLIPAPPLPVSLLWDSVSQPRPR